MTSDEFDSKITALCAHESAIARRDQERAGAMIESIARMLGMAIAASAHGNKAAIDELIMGAEHYIAESAVAFSESLKRAT